MAGGNASERSGVLMIQADIYTYIDIALHDYNACEQSIGVGIGSLWPSCVCACACEGREYHVVRVKPVCECESVLRVGGVREFGMEACFRCQEASAFTRNQSLSITQWESSANTPRPALADHAAAAFEPRRSAAAWASRCSQRSSHAEASVKSTGLRYPLIPSAPNRRPVGFSFLSSIASVSQEPMWIHRPLARSPMYSVIQLSVTRSSHSVFCPLQMTPGSPCPAIYRTLNRRPRTIHSSINRPSSARVVNLRWRDGAGLFSWARRSSRTGAIEKSSRSGEVQCCSSASTPSRRSVDKINLPSGEDEIGGVWGRVGEKTDGPSEFGGGGMCSRLISRSILYWDWGGSFGAGRKPRVMISVLAFVVHRVVAQESKGIGAFGEYMSISGRYARFGSNTRGVWMGLWAFGGFGGCLSRLETANGTQAASAALCREP
jgi:hypothetical protein